MERLIPFGSERIAAAIAPHAPSVQGAVAVVAAVAGLISVAIGAIGVLHASWKQAWLQERLMCERLRQFHFRTLAFGLPSILRSLEDGTARKRFLATRDRDFEAFKAALEPRLGPLLTNTLENEDEGAPWPDPRQEDPGPALESAELAVVFEAYRQLRIEHQRLYAATKLQEGNGLFSKYPNRQAKLFSTTSLLSIAGLFVVHLGVVLAALIPNEFTSAFRSPFATVGVIWLAVGALAIRALEAGLQPEREIERYQAYGSAVRAVGKRFDSANSAVDKHRLMMEMERLSFDEMRNFLVTSDRSRFVI